MFSTPTSRRRFMMGLGATGLTLPLLPSLSFGERDDWPTRLVIMFSANGTIYNEWKPTDNFDFKRILKPLERHKQDLIVLDGLDNKVSGPGDAHQRGMANGLTGAPILPGDKFKGGGNAGKVGWGGGISVDQWIGNQIDDATTFKTIEFGVQARGPNIWSRMSYAGSDQPITPQDDPTAMFERLFGNSDDAANAQRMRRIRAMRQSTLDYAASDIARIKQRISASERGRFENHLSSIRSIERRLTGDEGNLAMCTTPTLDTRVDFNNNGNFPQVGQLQTDMLVSALSCDVTRVATIQWSRSVSQTQFDWINVRQKHHDLSHENDNNGGAQDSLTKINTWYAERMSDLLDAMKAVPEPEPNNPDATLLDHSVVVWFNELSKGNNHSRNNLPFVLAGSANGFFRTGRYLLIDKPHNHLLVTLCHAMGYANRRTFGEDRFVGGLDELRA